MIRDRLRDLQVLASQAQPSSVVVDPDQLDRRHAFPDLLQQIDEVRHSIDQLEERIRSMQLKQVDIVSRTVVTPDQRHDLELAIDRVKDHISELRPRVREIDLSVRQTERSAGQNGALVRIQRNQCEQLKRRMQEVLFMFNNSQSEYKRRVSHRVKRQLEMAGQNMSTQEVEHMMDSNSEEVFYRQINPLSLSAHNVLEEATQRHNEILRLERSISELNEVFHEVYELVALQDNLVNNIARNVESATEYTKTGNEQITRAVYYKQKARRKALLLVLVAAGVGVALLVVILILVLPR